MKAPNSACPATVIDRDIYLEEGEIIRGMGLVHCQLAQGHAKLHKAKVLNGVVQWDDR